MQGPNVQMPNIDVEVHDGNTLTQEYASMFAALQRITFYSTRSGTTGERPSATSFRWIGMPYFDTTLGKPIFLKIASTNIWVDGVGTVS